MSGVNTISVAADKSIYCQAGHLHCGAAGEVSFTQCPLTERNESIRNVRNQYFGVGRFTTVILNWLLIEV